MELYSQERRRDWYPILLIWKISHGYDISFSHTLGRRGRYGIPKPVVRAAQSVVRNPRERSLGVKGVKMFNLLPDSLRSMNSEHIDIFNNHLDVFLSSDQPTMAGLGRATASFTRCPYSIV